VSAKIKIKPGQQKDIGVGRRNHLYHGLNLLVIRFLDVAQQQAWPLPFQPDMECRNANTVL